MGWTSISRTGEILSEDKDGRPVQAGDEGQLLVIIQEDYGHKIIVDLVAGVIVIDPESWEIQDRFYFHNAKTALWVCDDTNIVGEMAHIESTFDLKRDEQGRKIHDEQGKLVETRRDTLTPLTFRPIWFSRHYAALPVPVKVVGLQTTLPEMQGGGNYKRMVMLFPDGRLGIT